MAEHDPEVAGILRRPFREQSAFFRQKLGNLVPTRRWDDLTGAAHDTAFMVAGAQKADLLADLAAAVDRAIVEGKSLAAFRQDFEAAVDANDWRGWTGEETRAGRAWRTRTIYRTNAFVSYAAGRRAQLEAEQWRFWVYRHGGSKEPRPEHLAFDGLYLPPAHPFWLRFYPPSGWGCSCYVLGARSERGAKRLGGTKTAADLPDGWDRPDPRTGEPSGIDRGWGYAPGAAVAGPVAALAGKIGAWDYQIGKAFLTELPAPERDAISRAYRRLPSLGDDLRRLAQRTIEGRAPTLGPDGDRVTLGMLAAREGDQVKTLTGIDVSGYDVAIDRRRAGHVHDGHGVGNERRSDQWPVLPEDFALLPLVVDAPDEIVRERDGPDGQPRLLFRRRIAGATVEALFAIRGKRRRSLELVTMWIKK